MDITAWLSNPGLEHYEQPFRNNKIDESVLQKLTSEDLKELGEASCADFGVGVWGFNPKPE